MSDLKARLEVLEAENRTLSDSVALLESFLMATISLLAEEEDVEALRQSIESGIALARKTTQLDRLHDLQNLLRAFEAAMPKAAS